MSQTYTVVVEKGWSYIVGPNGYREGPIRYQWEAQEWADEMNQRALKTASKRRVANVAEINRKQIAEHAAAEALILLMGNPHISLGDLVYEVREREGKGWDGPAVLAWSQAVQAADYAIKLLHEANGALSPTESQT